MLRCTGLKLGGWVELGTTQILWVIFWQVLIIGVRCTSFLDFFWRAKLHGVQTRRVGGAWSNSDFVSYFLASCYYWSLLHEFLWFFSDVLCCMGLSGWSLDQLCFLSNILASYMTHKLAHDSNVVDGKSLGQLGFMNLFFGEFSW